MKDLVKNYIEPYRLGWLFTLIEATLVIITSIDKLVHQTLYKYGLHFNYAWADVYWILVFLLYQLIGLSFAATYWISTKEPRSRYLACLLYYTLNIQLLGGILDTFFFLIHGEFPSGTWWWNPFNRFLGIPWNTGINLIWNAFWILVTLTLWAVYFKRMRAANRD